MRNYEFPPKRLYLCTILHGKYAVVQLYEAMCYHAECRGIDSRWRYHLNPSGRTMAVGSTQRLTGMSTRGIYCGVKAAGV